MRKVEKITPCAGMLFGIKSFSCIKIFHFQLLLKLFCLVFVIFLVLYGYCLQLSALLPKIELY